MPTTTEIDELRSVCESVSQANESGVTFLLLKGLQLPAGCTPSTVDALLCPSSRDGYDSRLYFAQQIQTSGNPNWTAQQRILDRNWAVFSWRTQPGLRPAQMVAVHLWGLR
jgi:hypothetical protein